MTTGPSRWNWERDGWGLIIEGGGWGGDVWVGGRWSVGIERAL